MLRCRCKTFTFAISYSDELLLDIAAAVRGDAGRENVTSCGATSRCLQHR